MTLWGKIHILGVWPSLEISKNNLPFVQVAFRYERTHKATTLSSSKNSFILKVNKAY